jgi:DNA-directed RNA polymerase specialized sigma24 family protein
VTVVDQEFASVCAGDVAAFGRWMGRVERPIRLALRPFARAVDVESIVQETLARMWVFARDRGRSLTGDDASLRFAIGMARNLARNEARRLKREVHLPPEQLPEPEARPDPPPDPALRRRILECFETLAAKPLEAIRIRLAMPSLPDRALAAHVRMTVNTFLQNIVRARRQLAECLERKGVALNELLS